MFHLSDQNLAIEFHSGLMFGTAPTLRNQLQNQQIQDLQIQDPLNMFGKFIFLALEKREFDEKWLFCPCTVARYWLAVAPRMALQQSDFFWWLFKHVHGHWASHGRPCHCLGHGQRPAGCHGQQQVGCRSAGCHGQQTGCRPRPGQQTGRIGKIGGIRFDIHGGPPATGGAAPPRIWRHREGRREQWAASEEGEVSGFFFFQRRGKLRNEWHWWVIFRQFHG